MKKLFSLMILVLIVSASFGQMGSSLTRKQGDARYQLKSDTVTGTDLFYTETEVNSLLTSKQNISTGRKYVVPISPTSLGFGFSAGDALAANTVYSAKFYLPYSLTVDTFKIHITTGSAGNTISLAIYNSTKTTKLVAAESISATNTGVITAAVSPVTLTPGWYWGAYSNSNNAIRVMTLYSYGSTAFDADALIQGTAANSASSGVMPSTLGAISTSYVRVPIFSIQ